MVLEFRPFDADNHYYEPLDAFTRYQDPAMRRRGVQVLRDGKRSYILVADITAFSPDEVRMIMRDNVIGLLGGIAASE